MQWILVRIRWLQLKRQLKNIGILYTLLLSFFFLVAIAALFTLCQQKDNALYCAIGFVVLILSIHFSRKDIDFVWKQINLPRSNIFSEYLIFTLPFTLSFLFSPNWFYFPILIISFFIVTCLKIKERKRYLFKKVFDFIPKNDFEWIAGFRKNQYIILPLLLMAIVFCWVRILPLVLLWLFMIVVISFYQEGESKQFLYATNQSAKQFLISKILNHSKIVIILFLPILFLNTIFNPGMIFINIAFLILQLFFLILAIALKYTTYEPGVDNRGNTLLLSVSSFMILIPFLFLIPILLVIRNYFRAVQNLKFYFHD